MLRHVWSNYERHAFGKDQLKPVTGRGVDSWGGVAQTRVDSLDTCLGVTGGFWAQRSDHKWQTCLGHWASFGTNYYMIEILWIQKLGIGIFWPY